MTTAETHKCETKLPLSNENIAAAINRIPLIQADIQGAIAHWNKVISHDPLGIHDIGFKKAIRKFIEDAVESIKVFDCETGHGLLDALIEFDEWNELKGIRNIIVHQHWKVDDRIVFDEALPLFPTLDDLFGRLIFCNQVLQRDETWNLIVGEDQVVQLANSGIAYQFGEYPYLIACTYHCEEGWLLDRLIIIGSFPKEKIQEETILFGQGNPDDTRIRVRGLVPRQVTVPAKLNNG
ncbi:MAG: DUF86 domain-containing protein [Chloroflexota bacterium]|nr:DUF86 domain-containing protein [Chloroflexota bacterium]